MGSSISIGTNVAAQQSIRLLEKADGAFSISASRLSSGLRITRASDDAAGLSIASLLKTDSQVLGQALRNVNDGISALSIAEGAITELTNIVYRLSELSEQAANGTLSLSQRKPLQSEADQLVQEYERIASSTEFNNQRLLYNAQTSVGVQSGYGAANTVNFQLGSEMSRNDGTGSFDPSISLGTIAAAAATDDFNGDGFADMVIAGSGNYAELYLGNGNGTFKSIVTLTIGAGSQFDIGTGDFNGDGIRDVAVGRSSGFIDIFVGNGNGTFKSVLDTNIGGFSIYKFEIADVNNDGRDDIIAGNAATAINVYRSNANGSINSTVVSTAPIATRIIDVGDLNNDGYMDYITKVSGSANVGVCLGNGNGTFATGVTVSIGGTGIGVALADYNRDGLLDIFGADVTGVSVRLGNGNGTFKASTVVATGGSGTEITEARDITGDGIIDVVFTTGASVDFFKGNSDGTFKYVFSGPWSATRSGHLAIADYNLDGAFDIAGGGAGGPAEIAFAQTQKSSTVGYIYLLTQSGARSALPVMEDALTRLSKEAGVIGAYQERFIANYQTIQSTREQFITAASGIESADVAEETAKLVQSGILRDAGTAVLAQANKAPEIALLLLGVPSK